MRTVRWGTPSEVSQYEFEGGRRYTERELRDLAASGRVRSEGGDGPPLRIGYVCVVERGRTRYELDWTPEPPTMVAFAEDDPREWPVEPPPPGRESGGGGNDPNVGRPRE